MALQDLLDTIQTRLEAQLSTEVFHLEAPQNQDLPVTVWSSTSSQVSQTMSGSITRLDVGIEFDTYSLKALGLDATGTAVNIDDLIFTAMQGFSALPSTGFGTATVIFETRGVRFIEEDAIRVTSTAVITAYTT